MKQLLKPAILLLFVFFSLQSYSQVKFGLKAGPSITTIAQNYDDSDEEEETLPRILFTLGGVADIGFGDMISLQPGLMVSFKGYGVDVKDESDGDAKGYDRYTIAFLDVPVNVAFKFGKFQVYAGPYIAFGVWGKNKWDVSGDGWDESGDSDFKFVIGEVDPDDLDEDETPINMMDYGLGLGVGYKLGPVLLGVGGEIGLANLTPKVTDWIDDPGDYRTSTRSVSFTATFFFGD